MRRSAAALLLLAFLTPLAPALAQSGSPGELELPRGQGGEEPPVAPKPPVPPPTEPQPPAAPPTGPTEGALISAPGVFLDVRDGESYKAYELPLALDLRYRKVFVDFDLYLGRWQTNWFHGITSLKRNDKTLYYGLMLKGEPTTKTIVDLGRDRQVKDQFPWRERTQYHVRMTYDITTKRVTAQVFQDGSVIETVSGKMTNSDLRAFGKYRVRVDFGLPGVAHSAYYPPYGSRYANLTVRVER